MENVGLSIAAAAMLQSSREFGDMNAFLLVRFLAIARSFNEVYPSLFLFELDSLDKFSPTHLWR